MDVVIAFLLGLIVGSAFGLFVMAVAKMSKEEGDE